MDDRPAEQGSFPEEWDPEEYERARQERLARRQQRKRPRRTGPGGVPPIFLLAAVVVLLLIVLFAVFSSCGDENPASGPAETSESADSTDAGNGEGAASTGEEGTTATVEGGAAGPDATTPDSPDATGEITAAEGGDVAAGVGEPVMLGSVRVNVTSLSTTSRPTTPHRPVDEAAAIPGGGTFVQAFVYVQNRSADAVRVEPLDFTLVSEGHASEPVSGLTGPPARTLLPGASLDLIVSFPAPEGEISGLVYSPAWFPGSLSVTGERTPSGMTGGSGAGAPEGGAEAAGE